MHSEIAFMNSIVANSRLYRTVFSLRFQTETRSYLMQEYNISRVFNLLKSTASSDGARGQPGGSSPLKIKCNPRLACPIFSEKNIVPKLINGCVPAQKNSGACCPLPPHQMVRSNAAIKNNREE